MGWFMFKLCCNIVNELQTQKHLPLVANEGQLLVMKEMLEMFYQNQSDYVFDSSKFEARFGIKPTPYHIGLKETLRADFKINQ
jgi:hypothetical protein